MFMLNIALFCTSLFDICLHKAWAWTGDLHGLINIDSDLNYPIAGAGSFDAVNGLSLLGTLYTSSNDRGLIQLRLSSKALNDAINMSAEFSTAAALSNESQCSYQVYSPSGILILNDHCIGGWLSVRNLQTESLADERRVIISFELELSGLTSNHLTHLRSEGLNLIDPNAPQSDQVFNEPYSASTGAPMSSDQVDDERWDDEFDPFTHDEGCDFDDEYDDQNHNRDDWDVSCDEEVNEEGSTSDGCTDDEWAAEASVGVQKQRARKALRRWRHLNRCLPIICSLLFVLGWRRLMRFGNHRAASNASTPKEDKGI